MYVTIEKDVTIVTVLPCCTHASHTSKIFSSDDPLERPPMFDISRKLHAKVDEFVPILSSECNPIANTVSTQVHMYVAHDSGAEAAKALRLSKRTTTEVLNELRRHYGNHVIEYHNREWKSHIEHTKSNLQEENSRMKEGDLHAT